MSGREFRAIRLQLGLTQRQLAEIMGVQSNSIWRWEHRRKVLRLNELALKGVVSELGLARKGQA